MIPQNHSKILGGEAVWGKEYKPSWESTGLLTTQYALSHFDPIYEKFMELEDYQILVQGLIILQWVQQLNYIEED